MSDGVGCSGWRCCSSGLPSTRVRRATLRGSCRTRAPATEAGGTAAAGTRRAGPGRLTAASASSGPSAGTARRSRTRPAPPPTAARPSLARQPSQPRAPSSTPRAPARGHDPYRRAQVAGVRCYETAHPAIVETYLATTYARRTQSAELPLADLMARACASPARAAEGSLSRVAAAGGRRGRRGQATSGARSLRAAGAVGQAAAALAAVAWPLHFGQSGRPTIREQGVPHGAEGQPMRFLVRGSPR